MHNYLTSLSADFLRLFIIFLFASSALFAANDGVICKPVSDLTAGFPGKAFLADSFLADSGQVCFKPADDSRAVFSPFSDSLLFYFLSTVFSTAGSAGVVFSGRPGNALSHKNPLQAESPSRTSFLKTLLKNRLIPEGAFSREANDRKRNRLEGELDQAIANWQRLVKRPSYPAAVVSISDASMRIVITRDNILQSASLVALYEKLLNIQTQSYLALLDTEALKDIAGLVTGSLVASGSGGDGGDDDNDSTHYTFDAEPEPLIIVYGDKKYPEQDSAEELIRKNLKNKRQLLKILRKKMQQAIARGHGDLARILDNRIMLITADLEYLTDLDTSATGITENDQGSPGILSFLKASLATDDRELWQRDDDALKQALSQHHVNTDYQSILIVPGELTHEEALFYDRWRLTDAGLVYQALRIRLEQQLQLETDDIDASTKQTEFLVSGLETLARQFRAMFSADLSSQYDERQVPHQEGGGQNQKKRKASSSVAEGGQEDPNSNAPPNKVSRGNKNESGWKKGDEGEEPPDNDKHTYSKTIDCSPCHGPCKKEKPEAGISVAGGRSTAAEENEKLLPAQMKSAHSRLFQPWQPTSSTEDDLPQTSDHQPDYIELPDVRSYQELESHHSFLEIKSKFLDDIKALKTLACNYVDHQYDRQIDTFLDNLDKAPEHLRQFLWPLYRETRFQIHQLVTQLKDLQGSQNDAQKTHITSLLHECLYGIDLCLQGVHGRFSHNFLYFQASRENGLDAKLFTVKKRLLKQFVDSFLFQLQREGVTKIPSGMETHWGNGFYNLYCESLGLPNVADPSAPTYLDADLVQRFCSEVKLSVNGGTILRAMANEWSEQLKESLQQLDVSAWETNDIAPAALTADKTVALENQLCKPVNYLLETTGEQSLNLWTLMEEKEEGNFSLARYREKLLAWVSGHFCDSSSVKVLSAIPGEADSKSCIGTIGGHFFWVFRNDHCLGAGEECTFDAGNHDSLQLYHLQAIDFSTWAEVGHALLTQAMEQTQSAGDIASFFLHDATREQLRKIPPSVIQALSSQLTDKLAHSDRGFKEKLCWHVANQLASSGTNPVSPDVLRWLVDTPLLEPVLSELRVRGINISPITQSLNSWQISNFSQKATDQLLTPQDCQRLFERAYALEQGDTMSRLLLTGHCDQLTGRLNNNGENLLGVLVRLGAVHGVQYLLVLNSRELTHGNVWGSREEVTHRNIWGQTPLYSAARNGHAKCIESLLCEPDIQVNAEDNNGFTPLMVAASGGHARCIQELLRAPDIQVNAEDNNGLTPLMVAASGGHARCIQELLKARGIQVNKQDNGSFTALQHAATGGHARCIQELLKARGIQVNKANVWGHTPLTLAASEGHAKCIQQLLKADGIQINKPNNEGFTPLICAASRGHAECVQKLLDAPGIKVNKKDNEGFTPLIRAASGGHEECVQKLLDAPGIKVNKKDNEGFTPLIYAVSGGHAKCIQMLLNATDIQVNEKNNRGLTPLHYIVQKDQLDCLKALLNKPGIEVNNRCKYGLTPLHYAVENGLDGVKALLEVFGIQVNETDNNGFTPLHRAVLSNKVECIPELLKAHGIEVNKPDNIGCTPLIRAVRSNKVKCIPELLKADGIDVNKANNQGFTPLIWAARSDKVKCIPELLKADGIDVNKPDNTGNTPLISAAFFNKVKCIPELLKADGIDVNKANNEGCAPLTVAASAGHAECIQKLLEADGIDVNKADNMGRTLLHYIARQNQLDCLMALLGKTGIEVNSKCNKGFTPLHEAVCSNKVECINKLLEMPGIKVNKKDSNGCMPLHHAAFKGFSECLNALLGVSETQINEKCNSGATPLHFAVRCGEIRCIKALLEAPDIQVNEKDSDGSTPLHYAAEGADVECVEALLRVPGIQGNKKDNNGLTPLQLAIEKGNNRCVPLLCSAELGSGLPFLAL
ncbi:ankyrin repeat domain-containing protein [Endozoicomonas euniceicola]|uniref:Ankyrin repeat domain-containing protein n=1 Tax=Endozoicomonas euniceicola TaxID=1234143 RepID=A0ABY6GVJ0_9GAMM|nr:ankyrin repeat domain-containing protein [Endozoicomonas euniceicola]UYM16695.1 ankyrin repeat domain-containing protein [Endozoicomonas euniceicola]